MATYESMVFGDGNVTFYQVRPLSGRLSSDIANQFMSHSTTTPALLSLTTRLPSKASR